MYRKTININLNRSSIREAIKELEAYAEEIQESADELCEKLADIASEEAKAQYASMASSQVGNADKYLVTVLPIDGGYEVEATGDDVGFLEFGTGLVGYGHPLGGMWGAVPGSWSKLHANLWDSPFGWWFKDRNTGLPRNTVGHPPSEGMYRGWMKAQKSIERVAREVFR